MATRKLGLAGRSSQGEITLNSLCSVSITKRPCEPSELSIYNLRLGIRFLALHYKGIWNHLPLAVSAPTRRHHVFASSPPQAWETASLLTSSMIYSWTTCIPGEMMMFGTGSIWTSSTRLRAYSETFNKKRVLCDSFICILKD